MLSAPARFAAVLGSARGAGRPSLLHAGDGSEEATRLRAQCRRGELTESLRGLADVAFELGSEFTVYRCPPEYVKEIAPYQQVLWELMRAVGRDGARRWESTFDALFAVAFETAPTGEERVAFVDGMENGVEETGWVNTADLAGGREELDGTARHLCCRLLAARGDVWSGPYERALALPMVRASRPYMYLTANRAPLGGNEFDGTDAEWILGHSGNEQRRYCGWEAALGFASRLGLDVRCLQANDEIDREQLLTRLGVELCELAGERLRRAA